MIFNVEGVAYLILKSTKIREAFEILEILKLQRFEKASKGLALFRNRWQ